jgi:translocation and assembly module TamB
LDVGSITLVRGDEQIDASGRIATSVEAPSSDFSLAITNVNVGDLSTLLTGVARASGRVNGDMRLTGRRSDPEVAGTLTLTDGRLGSVPVSRAVVDVDLAAGMADVTAAVEPLTGAPLMVSGRIPTGRDRGDLDLSVSSPGIALGLVEGFTGQVANVTGTATADLRVTGTIEEPQLDGTVNIVGGGFSLVATGVTYQGLQASVRFDGRRASVDGLSVSDSTGHTLQVSGAADVFAGSGLRSFEAKVAADGLQVLANDLGDVAVRVDGTLVGDVAAPRLEGRVEVIRGRLEVDEILATLTTPPSAPTSAPEIPVQPAKAVSEEPSPETVEPRPSVSPIPPEPAPSASSWFSRSSIDVEIAMPDNLVLRGRDVRVRSAPIGLGNVNMTMGGTVELRKAADATPVVIGTAEVVRGVYDFQGRRFNVSRGSAITFRGATLNPSLDVTGEREVSGIVVEVRVTGTAREPEITLESRPPLDEADVLSLIIFNQPVNQLGDAERVDLVERAGTLAAGALATSLAHSIGRALDVDLFEIRAPAAGDAGEVTVGRQVNERLFVGFRQLFGDADASRLSFEYRISDALRLVTSFAQGGDQAKRSGHAETAGADLVYVIRY